MTKELLGRVQGVRTSSPESPPADRVPRSRPPLATRLGIGRWPLGLLVFLTACFLIFPMLITIPISFNPIRRIEFPPSGFSLRWYEEFLGLGGNYQSRWVGATLTSLRIAFATSVISTVLGSMAAIPIARARFQGKNLVQTFLFLPLVVPIIVLAVGLYLMYAPMRMLGSPLAIILGHCTLGIPYVAIIVAASLKNFDEQLEWAALSLGASRAKTYWKVTVPLVRPAILAGGLLAFLTSFDELLIALFVSGTSSVTLPRLLWDFLRTEASPVIAVVSTLLMVVAVVIAGFSATIRKTR